ncbi:NAD-dependent epimerase/dehydratase family protein [Niallia sp. 03133]|uniref:NAD-dependent epimerase/dehydratase family protein n=1 Tax=Niallia sp. 03133 TaxID=3458060 RepID=UPI004043A61F
MGKALVLGGTRFFGQHLVASLLDKGYEVTIATRGLTSDPFGEQVNRIFFDRNNFENFMNCFEKTNWDIVYDQICYSSKDALDAIKVFSGKTKKYILTSTLSVYDASPDFLEEEDFDPYSYPIKISPREDVSYQEGKRQAEAVFFQQAPFEVAAVRIPIVLGINDYTERLLFHIKKIMASEEIYFSNIHAAMGFIDEKEAGKFIAWAGEKNVIGPINACSNGVISIKKLLELIEEKTEKPFILSNEMREDNVSPYNINSFWAMSNKKAKQRDFSFTDLSEWLPKLVEELIQKTTIK